MQINREVAKMMLESDGFSVDVAENGQEAVDLVSEKPVGHYAAILMDIQMPVMDGYEATQRIRSLTDPGRANVPVIAVTANAFKEDIKKAIDAGMDAHVSKPVSPEAMMGTISRFL